MDERFRLALEQLELRSQRLHALLIAANEGTPLSDDDLREALHDAANIASSMRGLRLLIRKLTPTEPA